VFRCMCTKVGEWVLVGVGGGGMEQLCRVCGCEGVFERCACVCVMCVRADADVLVWVCECERVFGLGV
jgi:hypothetical protein